MGKYLWLFFIFSIIFSIIVLIILSTSPKKYSSEIGNRIVKNISGSRTKWNPYHFKNPEDYGHYWKKNRYKVIEELKDLTPNKTYKNCAVIHFRCSDVPFCKHPEYTLLPKEYFKFVSEKINQKQIQKIIIITCNTHNSNSLTYKCDDYSLTIKKWFKEFTNIPVHIDNTCQSIERTYEIFLGSKILVSTGGSFSFIPGITKDENFISPSLFGDNNFSGFENLYEKVHWTMWDKFDKISHNVNYKTFIY